MDQQDQQLHFVLRHCAAITYSFSPQELHSIYQSQIMTEIKELNTENTIAFHEEIETNESLYRKLRRYWVCFRFHSFLITNGKSFFSTPMATKPKSSRETYRNVAKIVRIRINDK